MSLESDAADTRGTQQDNQPESIRLASLNLNASDYSAFAIQNQSINQPNNFFSNFSAFNQNAPVGFNPYERQNINPQGFNPQGFNPQIFNPQQRFDQSFDRSFDRTSSYPPQMQRDPWQQYRMEAPSNYPQTQGRNDFWGNYWSFSCQTFWSKYA